MAQSIISSLTVPLVIINYLIFTSEAFLSSSVAQTSYQISENFGQNLTEEINNALDMENSSNYKMVLKEALQWSSIVYYETDTLLDKIEDIIPVIDLLNELKPDVIPFRPKIILSLNYLNKTNGKFLWRRMSDVYYNQSIKISEQNRSKLLSTLVAITVNFISPIKSDFSYRGTCPCTLAFSNYVKEYIHLYFGINTIKEGIFYSSSLANGCQAKNYFLESDLIYLPEISFQWNFPIFTVQFSEYMNSALRQAGRNTTIFVRSEVRIPKNYVWENRDYEINYAAHATNQSRNVTQNFVTKLYQNAAPLFNYLILSWASLKSQNIILGKAMQNVSGEIFSKENSRSKLTVPYIQMQNALEGSSSKTEVMLSEITKGYENVLMDEQTWRSLARYHSGRKMNFPDYIGNITHTQAENIEVLMQFSEETVTNWIYMEEFINKLLSTFPQISNFHLDTLIFKEENLKASVQIQEFINSTLSKHKVGCTIMYSRIKTVLYTASYGNNVSENEFKAVVEKNLCQPVFQLLSVMIWEVPEYSKTGALFSYYSDAFLARDIVQSYFPNITIFISFSSGTKHDKRVLADLYNVPIIFPW